MSRRSLPTLLVLASGGCLLTGCAPSRQVATANITSPRAVPAASPRPVLKTRLVLKRLGSLVSGMTEHGGCTLQVLEAQSGRPITDFEGSAQPPLHVTLITRDLSHWNYVELAPERSGPFKGQFDLPLILPMGRSPFKLIVEYTPRGGERTIVHHDLGWGVWKGHAPALSEGKYLGGWSVHSTFAAPLSLPPQNRLLITPHQSGHFDAGPEFLNSGALLQVAMAKPTLSAGQELALRFQLRDGKGRPLRLPRLRTDGWARCIIVSQDTNTYLRPTPEAASNSSTDAMFRVRFPSAGLYKAWMQWRTERSIVAAAFVMRVEPSAPGASR